MASTDVAAAKDADILLLASHVIPGGEIDGHLLISAFAKRGLRACWVIWDDATVPWASARLIIQRGASDQHRRRAEFESWLRSVSPEGDHRKVLMHPDVYDWNVDKKYLVELAREGVPVVPTVVIDNDEQFMGKLNEALTREDWDAATSGGVVVKPSGSAAGIGVLVMRCKDPAVMLLPPGPWVVQPLIKSVKTEGEISVFVFDGKVVGPQIRKRPAPSSASSPPSTDAYEEIRIHSWFGGVQQREPVGVEQATVALAAVQAANKLVPGAKTELIYARVDMMQWRGAWVVSELEAIDPALYLQCAPEMAEHFADLIVGYLKRIEGEEAAE